MTFLVEAFYQVNLRRHYNYNIFFFRILCTYTIRIETLKLIFRKLIVYMKYIILILLFTKKYSNTILIIKHFSVYFCVTTSITTRIHKISVKSHILLQYHKYTSQEVGSLQGCDHELLRRHCHHCHLICSFKTSHL